jgi:hypothetical protein
VADLRRFRIPFHTQGVGPAGGEGFMAVLRKLKKVLDLVRWAIVFRIRHPLRFILSYVRIKRSGLFDISFYERGRERSVRRELDPVVHYLVFGVREGLNPHPLFDAAYYRSLYTEVDASGKDPFLHYLERGSRTGLSPHPLFDGRYYRGQYPEVDDSGMDPFSHYLERGSRAGLSPHPLFDGGYYLRMYPDVEKAGVNHLIHYLLDGFRDGRNPHPLFSSSYYLERNRYVAETGLNPLVHYVRSGYREGMNPHPLFDSSFYLRKNDDVKQTGLNPLVHYLTIGWKEDKDPHPLFSNRFYKSQIIMEEQNPLEHYVTHSTEEIANPHPLFDNAYYIDQLHLTKELMCSPLELFLRSRNRDLCKPHPLFDPSFYLEMNSEISEEGINPLLHFVLLGFREGRNPHPLFDLSYYIEQQEDLGDQNGLIHYLACGGHGDSNPSFLFHTRYYKKQMKAANVDDENPLIHYLEKGWRSGFDPNPLFSNDFYLKEHPDVSTGALNPLIHYLRHGGFEGRAASPLFDSALYMKKHPDLRRSKMNPLVHYFQCGISENAATTSIYSPSMIFSAVEQDSDSSFPIKRSDVSLSIGRDDIIPIFCVYGPQHVAFIKNMSLSFFERQETTFRTSLHFVNYLNRENLLEGLEGKKTEIHDWSEEKEKEHMGFGESLNFLFRKIQPSKAFYIVNPDSYPLSGCLQTMADAICTGGIGIVEARQWPYEHPKEYDPETGDTPWASGAFSLLSAEIFRKIDGFDENFVLYAEDVDVSWRVWLEGARVVYRPDAMCCHLTGHPGYRQDRFYYEHFWSAVHFLVLAKKYFQETGEQSALQILRSSDYPRSFVGLVMEEYSKIRGSIRCLEETRHPMVRIWGLNNYHRLQEDAQVMKHRTRL